MTPISLSSGKNSPVREVAAAPSLQIEIEGRKQPHDAEMRESPKIVRIGVELERKRHRDADLAVLGREPREIFGHQKRLIAMFEHREAKDRFEPPSAELLVDFLERLGQIEHQIDARPFFHIDADVVPLPRNIFRKSCVLP